MSGHLDGPPPGPPDPPYIPGDLGAPSAEEFARRRASPTPEERNPYAPSADWKPGQDTFTSQAAGIWAEGFVAGRAAASPDPTLSIDYIENQIRDIAEYVLTDDSPEDPAPESQIAFAKKYADEIARFWASHRDATIHDATPAASPDERLREAGERLAQTVAQVCGEGHPALGVWRVALAAADREAPDECRAPHCWSEYGTPCATCPRYKEGASDE